MMRTLLPLAALVLTLPTQAQTLDQIVARHLQAQGTPEARKALKTLRLTLKMNVGPEMTFPMTITTVYPRKTRIEVSAMGTQSITVLNGKDSWWVQPLAGKPNPEPLPEAMMAQTQSQAQQFMSPLLDYQAKGQKLELVGQEKLEGADVFHLKLALQANKPIDLYLDNKTYLLAQMRVSQEVQGQAMDVTVLMGNYQPVAGVLLAHSIETKISGMPMAPKMTVEKAEPNITVDDAIFAMPARQPAEPAK